MSAPERRFGLPTLSALVVANMVGAGVFTTSGFALADLGSPARVLAAWGVGGLVALCGAAGYGALSRRWNESGGEYLFLARAVHPAAGFLAGWVSLLAGFTGAIAFAAHAFAGYLPLDLPADAVAVGVILVTAAAHGMRVRPGALAQNLAVASKLGVIVLFVAAAAVETGGRPHPEARLLDATPFSLFAFAQSLVWISLSYSGFNAAVYVAGEARDPERSVPRALLWGTALVTLLYLVLNAVFVVLAPADAVTGRPDVAAAAARALEGPRLEAVVRGLIGLALLTSVSSMMMAGPRVYARMAEDGLFPRLFRFRGEAPRAAVALQAVLAAGVVLLSDLQGLLSYLGLTLSVTAAATVGCVFLLRRREGAKALPVPGGVGAPGLYVGATLVFAALAVRRQPVEAMACAATLLSGLVAWRLLRRPTGRTEGDSGPSS